MFLSPAIIALVSYSGTSELKRVAWFGTWLGLTLLIGLRDEVGCDWWTYLEIFEEIRILPFPGIEKAMDPAYGLLNWTVAYFDGPIYWVNTVCGAIFAAGIIKFARKQPLHWMALSLTVPYLVIVVGMGYTRQGAALGLVFWGLAKLSEGRYLKYLLYVALGALFHKSALLMLPLAVFESRGGRIWKYLAIIATVGLLGVALLLEFADVYWNNYIDASLESEGGAIRVWMNVVPTLLMFAVWRRWRSTYSDYRIWLGVGLMAIICVPLVAMASTAVDRIAIYFSPIQIAVFSRLPGLVRESMTRTLVVIGILGYYTAVLWVWLNLGIHSKMCWIPYKTPWF